MASRFVSTKRTSRACEEAAFADDQPSPCARSHRSMAPRFALEQLQFM